MTDRPTDMDQLAWRDRKAELAALASRLAGSLAHQRRPLVIEFSGTPKAGKSLCVNALAKFLRRHDVPTFVVVERASVCPILNKNHPFFNVWTAATSLAQLLESLERNASVIILDRGLFDSITWMKVHRERAAITHDEYKTIADFLTLQPWRAMVDIVVALSVEPSVALHREFRDQITDLEGTIMNSRALREYNTQLAATIHEYGPTFRHVLHIDTSHTSPMEGVTTVACQALAAADAILDEEVAVIPRSYVTQACGSRGLLRDHELIRAFVRGLKREVQWMRRAQAERSTGFVQLIPAAVIMAEGSILVTEIRGGRHGTLSETRAVWVGGHLRASDAAESGKVHSALRACLARELTEELTWRIPETKLPSQPSAIVWDDTNERSARHLGVLYDVERESAADIGVFDRREFWENQTSSLFTEVCPINQELSQLPNWEMWSKAYLSACFGVTFPGDVRQRVLF